MSEASDWADYEAAWNEAYRIFRNCLKNVAHMASEKKEGWGDSDVEDALRVCHENLEKAEKKAWQAYFDARLDAFRYGE